MYKRLLVPLTIIASAVCVQAQQGGRVYLGVVDGLVNGNIEAPSSPVTFHFYYENYDPVNKARWTKNPFELSATGDVTWTTGDYGDEFSWGPATNNFDYWWAENLLSWDGSGADTIEFSGAVLHGAGLPPGYNGPAVYLTVVIDDVSSTGETFCIDSSLYPTSGFWMWSYGSSVGEFVPDWDGPHCWDIIQSPCAAQSWDDSAAYDWRSPHPAYGVKDYAQRYTSLGTRTLVSATLAVHNMGTTPPNISGNDDLIIKVWDDDGFGYPGSVLATEIVPAGTYSFYPTLTYVDFSSHRLIFEAEDFYISFNSTGTFPNDCEAILSDDETTGHGRSYCIYNGNWWKIGDLWGIDVDLKLTVQLCQECCVDTRGNMDDDPGDMLNISDLVYLVDYMFADGTAPRCWQEANIDAVGPDDSPGIDINDLIYMVDFMFNEGPPPMPCP